MMKLKLLVVAAAIAALPAMGHAQSMSKDSMMMKGDTMMKHDTMMKKSMKKSAGMMKTEAAKEGESASMEKKEVKTATRHRAARREKMESGATEKMENMAMKTPPMDGTSCPMKCPSSKGAGGLTGPQFLALQQELRDRGCGNAHVTGWMDSPTRRAIATCAKKMNVANKASALLVAMNIGYSDADVMGKM